MYFSFVSHVVLLGFKALYLLLVQDLGRSSFRFQFPSASLVIETRFILMK